ncbi:uncharacterized protein RVIR1_08940 [Candidatus Rickettsiella viridis]|uniref:Transposase n=1 Tax=Candidatus Rickettsiella viridis TaxID=676208 RepID=A0A2Z5UWD1_9COXI|nr:cytosolic protein [Candidatus Rickettsiella viridis]BBB15375.1 uncharacterized protein RVIR1_08940 [Candidatus Rickettsiella viridis]
MSPKKQNKKLLRSEQDSAWKDILDAYFKEFIEFFYPVIAKKIDWLAGYEALDSELQSITTDAMIGKTFVDKLVKVKSLDGKEEVVLIHIEVQSQKEEEFPKRLFQYYCKLFSKYDQSILTLAILTDSNKTWHPKNYERIVFDFPVISFNFWAHKLLDYDHKKQELEVSTNPFAMVVLVQLVFLNTKKDPNARSLMKFKLTRRLYDKGYKRDYVINLLKVIDWALVISENLELEYKQKLHKLEEERNMAYITSFERDGLEKGLQQGERRKALAIARNLLNQNVPLSVIKSATGLSEQEIELEDA